MAEQSYSGPLSPLSDVTEVAEAISGVLCDLFTDYEPTDEDGQRSIFAIGASLLRGNSDNDELIRVAHEAYREITERPYAEWMAEISYDAIAHLAQALVNSRERPDTQIIGPSTLEMLIRDETSHSTLTAPAGTRIVQQVSTPIGTFTVTVSAPSTELLMRLALRRTGIKRSAVFDRQQLYAYLMEQEQRRALTEDVTARISVHRLLNVMASPGLRSLRIEGSHETDSAELEGVATAFRVRLAYESDIVLAPVLDVNCLPVSPSQPSLIRQLHARRTDFVEAISGGVTPGFVGDHLLGQPTSVDEELSLRYLRAVAATDPFSAFMGYYHVLEHEMEDAWFNNLHRRVSAAGGVLQRPVSDVRAAEPDAAIMLNVNRNEIKFTELKALQSLLEDRVDVDDIRADLAHHLDGALDYFSTGYLPFAEVPHLDFAKTQNAAGQTELKTLLAKRIYRVRCAITHSKASSTRYSPYTDDLYLGREVPLVRLAAEQLLIPSDHRL
ncbi:hypothetical protein OG417_25165 [Actinoallomurus sp. NBC_01490]|uniref:hypothetical protein n=1 Tax=Actinoallomurus sp. NBC_01490 TaxID=2903557 RepID=UPI002E305F42|nr:hypothetical protein [Actinoallomurus sp. NBC_01490]